MRNLHNIFDNKAIFFTIILSLASTVIGSVSLIHSSYGQDESTLSTPSESGVSSEAGIDQLICDDGTAPDESGICADGSQPQSITVNTTAAGVPATEQLMCSDGTAPDAATGVCADGSQPQPQTVNPTATTNPPVTQSTMSNMKCDPNENTIRKGSTGAPVINLQNILMALGFNPGPADGIYGTSSENAVKQFQQSNNLAADGVVGPNTWAALCKSLVQTPPTNTGAAPPNVVPSGGNVPIAWGTKVSSDFKTKVIEIARDLGTNPDFLMAAMYFESGGTFSPSILNKAGSGAVGLIQFMPKTAINLGTTVDQLKAMSAVDQLEFVKKYLLPYKGRLNGVEDVYMSILWPVAVGKPVNVVLFDSTKTPITYKQNKGLDVNNDGTVTKTEAAAQVIKLLASGSLPANAR